MSVWGSVYFQNGVSPVMEQLIFFHDHTMIVMIMVMIVVGYMLMNSYFNKSYNLGMFEGQELESVWTILPAIFLLFIAFPSLQLLYLMEEFDNGDIMIKVMGHQWYWTYEYEDLLFQNFESYMVQDDLSLYRLLNVDNNLLIPEGIDIKVLVSSTDVIHSWTIPSLGIKSDAIPGRLNQMSFNFNRVGMFSGQCSEICGANHSFMPIMLIVMDKIDFMKYI